MSTTTMIALQTTNNNSDNSIIKLPQPPPPPPPPQQQPNNTSSSSSNHHRTLSKQQQKHSAVAHDVLKLFTSTHHPLHAIFHPNSVVLIGASERSGSVGRTILWNLISSPFGGSIYFVNSNPRRKSVFGIKTYLRVQDVVLSEQVGNNDGGGSSRSNSMEDDGDGGGIDLAIIAVPAHAVKDVLQDCVEVGVKSAIILSAGFKEVGVEGAQLESEIRTIAQHGNIRVIGPNCLGVMNPITGLNATFATHLAKPGNVAFISQSGAMCTSILDWSLQANVGFSAFVSIGSMMDVSWGDIIYYLGDDPNTKAIAIYMESIGDARSFMSAASEVAMSKPIILIKPGRTDQAAKAAASHTGSLAGSDDVLDAAFKRCGVLRVNKIRDVFEIVELLGKQPRPSGKYLTIVTNAGGPGVISTDALIESGGQLAWLSEDTMNRLNDILPSSWSHANPIDVLGDATWETYSKAVEIASENEFSDGILIILTPQSMTDPTRTAQAIADVAKKIKKPILASWMGGKAVAEGRAILDAAGIPSYDYPDSAAEMFSYMYQLEVNLNQLYETPRWCADFVEAGKSMTVDSIISNAQSQGRVILTELESKLLLSCYSIPTPPTTHCRSAEEAAAAATNIGFPVVVKLHSETITHKTDVGGVKLNLHSPEQVYEAFNEMQQGVNETDFLGVTVQPMFDTTDSFELIIGTSLDNQFGPVMLFGTGGTLVEIFNDKSLALPPLNSNLAHLMMKNTKIYKALKGVRGRKSADIPAIEKLIVNFSHLIMDKWMFIKEVEINPLLASQDSVMALDARVILHDPNLMEVDNDASTQIIRPAIRPYPTQYEQHWVSKKGRVLQIRAIKPEDEPLVVDFHKRLSEESVYTRWMSNMGYDQRASHSRLIRVCHVDYDRDIALVALDDEKCAGNDCKLVAAARLTKMHGVNVAEFSVLVEDNWQGQGIGGKLLLELIKHGRADGLDAIEAIVLPTNRAMIHVAEKMGFESIYDKDLEVVKQYYSYKEPKEVELMKEDYPRRFTCPNML